jgi:hypothetical protein
MNLYDATTEVHHDAESSDFGKLIKNGELTKQQYADWLFVQFTVHSVIDAYLPSAARRLPQLYLDMADLSEVAYKGSESLMELMKPLYEGEPTSLYVGGLCYVFTGAHLRGGPQNRKSLEKVGLPCRHLRFNPEDAKKADEYLKELRDMVQFAESAKEVFRKVLSVMDEISHG